MLRSILVNVSYRPYLFYDERSYIYVLLNFSPDLHSKGFLRDLLKV